MRPHYGIVWGFLRFLLRLFVGLPSRSGIVVQQEPHARGLLEGGCVQLPPCAVAYLCEPKHRLSNLSRSLSEYPLLSRVMREQGEGIVVQAVFVIR